MGVHGLWKLLEPSGKPVPLETLENKILAVDVSIWLHQVVKGFQDSKGNPLPNAHLLGLFHRVCKLLFYKIRPVFVFDGGVPHLKKQTVITRRQQKSKAELEADRIREQLLKNLVKHAAVKRVLGNSSKSIDLSDLQKQKDADMFELPAEKSLEESESRSEDETVSSDEENYSHRNWNTVDLHAIDVNSTHFKSLPADVRHDILSELKETRKQSSWGRLHEMPKESSDFSSFQMNRLLKRRSVQVSLEDAEKEMGGRSLSLGELQEMLSEQGVVRYPDDGHRIASDSTTRYLYIKDITNQVLQKNSNRHSDDESSSHTKEETKPVEEAEEKDIKEKTEEKDIKEKTEEKDMKEKTEVKDMKEDKEEDFLKDILSFIPEEEEEEEEIANEDPDSSSNSENEYSVKTKLKNNEDINLKVAQNFMFENSGLTQKQILAVIQYQNAIEDNSQNNENFFSPDQPSTSGITEIKKMKSSEPAAQNFGSENSTELNFSKLHGITPIAGKFTDIKADSNENSTGNVNSELNILSQFSKTKVVCNLTTLESKEKAESLSPGNAKKEGNTQGKSSNRSETNTGLKSSPVVSKENEDVDSKETQETSSDTDESFVEVDSTVPSATHDKNTLEVVIQKDKPSILDDDIFADIFTEKSKESVPLVSSKGPSDTVETAIIKDKEIIQMSEYVGDIGIKGTKSLGDISVDGKERKSVEQIEGIEISNANCRKEESPSENKVETAVDDKEPTSEENIEKAKDIVSVGPKVSSEDLLQLQASLQEEQMDLMAEQGRQERLAANITDQMCVEAQELLQLFGVPYIVAPMEAEAQCAFLDIISLTDGTITDDSDIWLFGGQKVYKNFFNQKKHVLRFQASDIKHYFNLERLQMVMLALLVGSDYTPGLQGVGPVTALEILAAFPSSTENKLAGLQKFRDWMNGGMKVGPGKTPLKNKLKNIRFIEGFPNQAVIDAYLSPKVDESKEAFSWAFPDLESLREFTKRKFGWARTKADEILLPVMKKQEERKSQRSLDSYFKVIPKLHAADGKLSRRVQQAVQRIGRETTSDSEDNAVEDSESVQPKRKRLNPNSARPKSRTGRGRGRGRGKCEIPSVAQEPNKQIVLPGSSTEFIPQRERDKINALKSKLRAIEVFRTSKIDRGVKKPKCTKRRVLKEAKLSESSSDSD